MEESVMNFANDAFPSWTIVVTGQRLSAEAISRMEAAAISLSDRSTDDQVRLAANSALLGHLGPDAKVEIFRGRIRLPDLVVVHGSSPDPRDPETAVAISDARKLARRATAGTGPCP